MGSPMGLSSYVRPRNPFLKGDSYIPTEREYPGAGLRDFPEDHRGKARHDGGGCHTAVGKEVFEREEFLKLVYAETPFHRSEA